MALMVKTTTSFDRVAKKLHPIGKKVLDDAVKEIALNPFIGEEKRGDLVGVFAHKLKLNSQETLLAYMLQPDKQKPTAFVLLSVGSHENFYLQFKRAQ